MGEFVISKSALTMSSGPTVQNNNLVLERTFRILSAQTLPPNAQRQGEVSKKKDGRTQHTSTPTHLNFQAGHIWGKDIRNVHSSATEVAVWAGFRETSTHVALGVPAKNRKERHLPTKWSCLQGFTFILVRFFWLHLFPELSHQKDGHVCRSLILSKTFAWF